MNLTFHAEQFAWTREPYAAECRGRLAEMSMENSWSETGKTKLKEAKLDPDKITASELRAQVDWLKNNQGDRKAFPLRSLYDPKSKNPVFTKSGSVVRRSKAWVYGKLKPAFDRDLLEWTFQPWATTGERSINLTKSGMDVHLDAIVVGLHSHDLHESLLVPSP